MKARDNMVRQAEKAGIKLPSSYVWTLLKGNIPVETIWFNIHNGLAAYGTTSDAWAASGVADEVLDRFYNVSTCSTGMGTMRPIFQREVEMDDDAPTVIAALGCTYKHGIGPNHMGDLATHMNGVMQGMGDKAPIFAGGLAPFTARPAGSPDVLLFSVYQNMSGWSTYVNELFSTPAGQRMRNHMSMLLDCDVTLWGGQQVVEGAES